MRSMPLGFGVFIEFEGRATVELKPPFHCRARRLIIPDNIAGAFELDELRTAPRNNMARRPTIAPHGPNYIHTPIACGAFREIRESEWASWLRPIQFGEAIGGGLVLGFRNLSGCGFHINGVLVVTIEEP